jgi:hypothetical protein
MPFNKNSKAHIPSLAYLIIFGYDYQPLLRVKCDLDANTRFKQSNIDINGEITISDSRCKLLTNSQMEPTRLGNVIKKANSK